MTDVLIGHTGFVGSSLVRQHDFDLCVNSKTISNLAGKTFDTLVCAGVSAAKWQANKDPEGDVARIKALTDVLDTVTSKRFVLISTVDVFMQPNGQTEDTPIQTDGLHAYGLNRLKLEHHLAKRFSNLHILRLPALFGPGLRKNVLFDLLNDNMLEFINPSSQFQWYPTRRLWRDIEAVLAADLKMAHLATEPVATSDILTTHFQGKTVGSKAALKGQYDFHTRNAKVFGSMNPYIMDRAAVLKAIGEWLEGELS